MDKLNIGILAHVDAGKTTTVEQILYLTGKVRMPGKIEKGNTQTDWMDIERKRGISIKSAAISFDYKECKINLIDTPGHIDFAGEVERALSVLDAAILIVSASEGIQSQTEVLWNALSAYQIPLILFLNKIDLPGYMPEDVYQKIRKEFTHEILSVNSVSKGENGHITLAESAFTEDDLLLLCEKDELLCKQFLSGEKISNQHIKESMIRLSQTKNIIPLVFGTASQGLGIDTLLDTIVTYLPRPNANCDGALSGIVYKIEHHKQMGKIAHIRLFSGLLKNRDTVEIHHLNQDIIREKVTQIRSVSGARQEDSGILSAGDIAAVYGLTSIRTGDIIGEWLDRKRYPIAIPLFSVKVTGHPDKRTELLKAVSELSDEDPILDYEWEPETRELHLKIMGKIQIEVLEFLLFENYGLKVQFSNPSVIYKETPLDIGTGFEAYTMPKPCWAVVKFLVEPMPRGTGVIYETAEIREEQLFTRYRNHIEQSTRETLKQGIYGWEVTDLRVRLIDGEHHLVHTHPMDFFLATPIGILRALDNAGTTLLEPLLDMEIHADENLASKLIGEIISMRGNFENPYIKKGKVIIHTRIPVSTSMDFPVRFSSLTSGKGLLKSKFADFQPCPLELGHTLPRRGVDPLDRDRWILYKRGAL